MNEVLIKNWNSLIGKEDIVYHLGDFGFGDEKQIEAITNRLNGRKFLILGNHDRYRPTKYMELGFEWASRHPIIYDEFCILSHAPVFLEDNSPYANLYGHLHQNTYQSKKGNYYNCCVEHHDYFPIKYSEIKKHFIDNGFKTDLKIKDIDPK
jgi:calcineurin-like phosphoesterase family protein